MRVEFCEAIHNKYFSPTISKFPSFPINHKHLRAQFLQFIGDYPNESERDHDSNKCVEGTIQRGILWRENDNGVSSGLCE